MPTTPARRIGSTRRRRRIRDPHRHHRRRAGGLRCAAPAVGILRRRRRPSIDRGRPAAGPRHRGDGQQAAELWKIVDRPNVFIKIPATPAGLSAITATIAKGISVNVTLIFSVERHRQVMNAYLDGMEAAQHAGRDLSGIHSVASLFVSRVDTEIDQRLDAIGTDARTGAAGTGGNRQRPTGLCGLPAGLRSRASATPHSATPVPPCSGRYGPPPE